MRVQPMVLQLISGCSSQMHQARVGAVVKAVEGIVRGGRLSPATIGRNLPGSALPKHAIKCMDRLLGSSRFWHDRLFVFLAIAHQLLRGNAFPVILIDWTKTGRKHEALVAAVPIGGRALPIYLEAHPIKKMGNAAVERRFLCSLRAILPENCQPTVVTDAGFKGPFFDEILNLGWNFVGRIRGHFKATTVDTERVFSKEELYLRASPCPTDLGKFRLFIKEHGIPARLVVLRKRRKPGPKRVHPKGNEQREHRQTAQDPWLLATSMPDADAAKIASIYAKRMQIEETFRDAKNHRFGWSLGDVNLSTTRRTANLLLLATVAMVVVTLIGLAAEKQNAHRAYQANTEKRRVLSFFVLACAILRRADFQYLSLDAFRSALWSISVRVSA
jgi:hypothetical protein